MVFHSKTVLVITLTIANAGCKVSNPLDRTVRVTQQPATDDYDFQSPKTRLATGANSQAQPSSLADSSPATRPAASRTRQLRAANTRENREDNESTRSLTKAPAEQVPDEYADLMDAFQDSPPEVQQQAIRQLIALSGRNAARTQSPEGIAESLKASMKNLPALPDDSPDAINLPTRLASNSSPQPMQDIGQVAQASGEVATTQLEYPVQQTTHQSDSENLKPIEDVEPKMSQVSDIELYDELIRRLNGGVPGESDSDRYRRQIIARHLMLFSGDPDKAVAAIDGMTPTEQEFLRHYLLGIWSMIDTAGHPVAVRRWSAALPEMRTATQQLSAVAESLDVKSLAFCKEIQSFGQVTKFENSRFEAGQKVILYCEIDNFVAKSTAAGFETALQGSYEIFDAKGQKVAGQVLPADKQVCANYLRDYFIAYQMGLPAGLEPGDYRLELTMECLHGQKYGQASVPVTITAAPAAR